MLNHRGVLAARLGDAATAEAACHRANALQPKDAYIHSNPGQSAAGTETQGRSRRNSLGKAA